MENSTILDSGNYLIIDTALSYYSACIACKGKVLGSFNYEIPSGQSGQLLFKLQKLFQKLKLNPQNLSAICIGMGPGSYTGLRIGMSSMKGLAFADNIPLYGFSTLQAIAMAAGKKMSHKGEILALIDARRSNAYAGLFRNSGKPVWNNQFVGLQDENFSDTLIHCDDLLITSDNVELLHISKLDIISKFDAVSSDISSYGELIYHSKITLSKLNSLQAEPLYLKPPNITTPRR